MNVYEIITQRIMDKLEQGTVPWHKPWASNSEMPKNLISKKTYRGINVFMLHMAGYSSPYWLSYKQASELGGTVKKGEHGLPIVFWNWKETKNEETGKKEKIPFIRYYTVFNADQCSGLESKVPAIPDFNPLDFNPITECEGILNGMSDKPEITHNEAKAYYRPSNDTVNMPKQETFCSVPDYYSVLFHELVHSTGHEKRLNRHKEQLNHNFGSNDYSKEELIAEMGASFLSGLTGITTNTIDNSAAYIKSWLVRLKDDPKMVVMAAAKAQKAVDYITGKQIEDLAV